jgi:hypothetical protein
MEYKGFSTLEKSQKTSKIKPIIEMPTILENQDS